MNETEFSAVQEIVTKRMSDIFCEIPYGIEHTLKVLQNAEKLMAETNISVEEHQIIILASLLHDIGAVEAMRKYSSIDGKYQEMEGPAIARNLLEDLVLCDFVVERVCYIVGNHHSEDKIDGKDFQIVWNADQLEQI